MPHALNSARKGWRGWVGLAAASKKARQEERSNSAGQPASTTCPCGKARVARIKRAVAFTLPVEPATMTGCLCFAMLSAMRERASTRLVLGSCKPRSFNTCGHASMTMRKNSSASRQWAAQLAGTRSGVRVSLASTSSSAKSCCKCSSARASDTAAFSDCERAV